MRELACAELVELVTAYLEGALDPETEARFVGHVADCEGCATYVEQIRETVRLTGRLTSESLAPQARDRLLAAFRDWPGESGRGQGGEPLAPV